jgi:hypothetical protein
MLRELQAKHAAGWSISDLSTTWESRFGSSASRSEVYGYVRSMPIFPIRGRDLGVGVVTYVIPIIALIWHR